MMTHFAGNESYQAPEMISNLVYDEKVDIWSAGCILYTMLSGFQPFYDEK